MAVENLGKCISLPAYATLAAKQYYFMKLSGGKVTPAGDGEDAIGVLQDDPASADRAACVMVGTGITKVVAGGTVTQDGQVGCDSSGRAVDAASGDYILGRALTGTTTAGEIISIIFQKGPATL